jgi:hypothetical protein
MLASSEALWLLTTDVSSVICARRLLHTFGHAKVCGIWFFLKEPIY